MVRVAWLAKALGKDPRTIRRRLRTLVLRYEGAFVDKAESAFALVDGLRRVLEKAVRAERAEVDFAGRAFAAATLWGKELD